MYGIENAKIHIYMPKENITSDLIRTWTDNLNKVNPKMSSKYEALMNVLNKRL
jgi:hypothetical protein